MFYFSTDALLSVDASSDRFGVTFIYLSGELCYLAEHHMPSPKAAPFSACTASSEHPCLEYGE